MSQRQARYEAFVSPIGTAVWPYLTAPDTRHDVNGIFHVDVSVPADIAETFVSRLDGALDKYINEELSTNQKATLARKPVFKNELTYPEFPEDATDEEKDEIKDGFTPEETGNLLFRVKMAAQFTTKKGEVVTQRPIVVSTDGERVTESVFMGSTLRVKGQIVPYISAASQIVGISLRLKSAQIIDLVSGAGGKFWSDFDEADDEG